MVEFPARGQQAPNYWDQQLKQYIDEADTGLSDELATGLGTKADAGDTTAALESKADLDGTGALVEEQVPDRLSVTALSATFGAPFPLEKFGALTPGGDDTAVWQAALNFVVPLAGTILVPPGITTRTGPLNVPGGRCYVDLQGSTLRGTATAGGAAIFKNNYSSLVDFTIRNGRVLTDTGVVDFRIVGAAIQSNVRLYADNLEVNHATTEGVADFFYLRKTDFLHMEKIVSYGAKRFLVVTSAIDEFANTQIHLKNLAITQAKTAVLLERVDKATLQGVDIAKCGAGIVLGTDCKRVTHIACHVENYGFTGLDNGDGHYGRAFYIGDPATFPTETTYIGCSALLPSANATQGFGRADQGATGLIAARYINCRAASDLTLPSYRPVQLAGSMRWEGRWTFTTDAPIPTAPYWVDVVVRDEATAPQSRNLLRLPRVSRTEDLAVTGGGTFAVTAGDGTVQGGRTLTFTGSREAYTNVSLPVGWHTILVQGYGPQDVQTYVMDGTDFTVRLSRRFTGATGGQKFVLPFYVPTARTHRIGFRSTGTGGSAQVSRWELHEGFVEDFTADTRASWQIGGTAPSTGAYDQGDQVWRADPAASASPGWICTTAPNTFKAMASLGA